MLVCFRQLEQNARMLSHLSARVDRNFNDLKLLSKHASMVTTQIEQVLKAQNDFLNELNDNSVRVVTKHASMVTTQVEQVLKAQNDLLNELNDNSIRVGTRGGRMTQEHLYPEGHPKRIEQDYQGVSTDAPSHPRKKKEDDRNLHASNPVAVTPENPNDISVSDAKTQSCDELEPNDNIDSDVHVDAQPSNEKDVEIEPSVDLDNPQPKNKRCDKNDFATRKHGKERVPWVQKPMPFPPKPSNDISVSDAKTQSCDELEPNDNIDSDVHVDAQPSNEKDVEIEPSVDLDNPQPKNKRCDKNDFATRKHGKERVPWVQKPMPFPPKPCKKKDDEDF